MMRLPEVSVHFPTTVAEAVALHAGRAGALYLAGGTDLIPNLKHRLYDSRDLISLSRLPLAGVTESAGEVSIGAGSVLADLTDDPTLRAHLPALADALALVAGPLHRNRATLGGNVMLDTRCLYYNQTPAWREALGHCLKKDGDWCHVIGSAKRCVAARSNDSAPILMALDARLDFATPDGDLTVPVRELYAIDGRFPEHCRTPRSALLTRIRIPAAAGRRTAVYRKVRRREAIDFPQLGVAAVQERDAAGLTTALTVVLGALMPEPRLVKQLDFALGVPLDGAVIDRIAAAAAQQAHAQESIHGSPDWRKAMAGVETRRALEALA